MRFCLDETAILKAVGGSGPTVAPRSIPDFYELAIFLQNENKEQEKQVLIASFDYKLRMSEHLLAMDKLILEISLIRKNLQLTDLSTLLLPVLLRADTLAMVQAMYVNIAYMVDRTVRLRSYNKIGSAVALSYHDDNTIKILAEKINQFEEAYIPTILAIKATLAKNSNYLNSLANPATPGSETVKLAVANDPRLAWYWNERKTFDDVLNKL